MIKSIFLFIAIILCGCVNYALIDQEKYNSVEKVNARLLDTTLIDTTKWAIEYNNFIKEINPTNRNYNDINETLQKNVNDICTSSNTYANKLGIAQIDTVCFLLSPDGSLMISSVNSKTLTDTTELNAIKKILANVHFEQSKDGKYYCRFSIVMVKNSAPNAIRLNPAIIIGAGRRSKSSIMGTVMKYIQCIRYAYNRRLNVKPGISGKLVVKFAINQYGQVIFIRKESSTLSDELLYYAIIQQIHNWKFSPLLTKDDITEVVYPFVFSQ